MFQRNLFIPYQILILNNKFFLSFLFSLCTVLLTDFQFVSDVYPQMADKHQHLNEERELEELLTMIVINQMKAEQESKL
jgi:hypothetical protein